MLGLGASISNTSYVVQDSFVNSKSLSFDGTNDFAKWASNTVITNLIGGGDFSWSYWTKMSAFVTSGSGYNSTLFYALNFYGAGLSTFIIGAIGEVSHGSQARKLVCQSIRGSGAGSAFFNWTSDASISSALSDDAWHHIVFTFDNSGSSRLVTCYIDGNAIAGTNVTTDNSGASFSSMDFGNIALGSQTFNAGSDAFDANELDEISCYNAVLSSSNVTDIYNSGVPKDESSRSNLVGYWRLEDDGSDSSSNSNTLTIDGASFTTDVPS